MKTIVEFFKNRISFTVLDETSSDDRHRAFWVKDYKYMSKIHNLQCLNIKNSFDLVEKLISLFC